MNSRSVAVLAAGTFLMGVVQFFASMAGAGVALAAAALLPLVNLGLMKMFEAELPNPWIAVAPPFVAGAVGVGLWAVAKPGMDPLYWLGPVVAAAVAAGIVYWQSRDERRCALCSSRLGSTIAFPCPRCGMLVCEAKCWDFERVRCQLCVQNAVPLFPPKKQWWDQNVGLTTKQGKCQRCQVGPEEAELRTCPKCGRPQCLECWDDANGVCTRCQWRVAALPEALKAYLPAGGANQ